LFRQEPSLPASQDDVIAYDLQSAYRPDAEYVVNQLIDIEHHIRDPPAVMLLAAKLGIENRLAPIPRPQPDDGRLFRNRQDRFQETERIDLVQHDVLAIHDPRPAGGIVNARRILVDDRKPRGRILPARPFYGRFRNVAAR